jgi:RTX calcium-binding nonapeptide repeat (4 copies)
MKITVWIATLASLLMPAWLGSASAGASVGADLRVVATSGALDDITQYSDTTTMPTSPQADCFGPGSGGSGQGVTVQGANALGIVGEAAKSRNRLNPLLLTDKFVPDGFGLGVCGIGGQVAQGSAFWYTKVNHTGLQVGGSQFPIRAGDQVLWYLAPNFPPPAELVLNAPVRGPLGTQFPVQVLAYGDDGTAAPAAGAVISGGATPVTADASGNAQVTVSGAGVAQIQAARGADIPSAATTICSAARIADCPAAPGRLIVGSDSVDEVVGSAGPDRIKPRAGKDRVRALAGDDRIDVRGGGKDRLNCGGGDDSVKADKRDKMAKNCEHRSRSSKRGKHGKHKGERHRR